jgi:hypothetical protein
MGPALMGEKMRSCLLACLALASPLLAQPQTVVEPRLSAQDAPRGPALLRRAMLAGHNAARAAVGVPPLVWDERLAADAARYVATLARTGRFQHDPALHAGPIREGENLFEGTRGGYAYAEMVALWVGERRFYRPGPVPAISTTGNWEDVGHYSQIIWRGTTAVGCATASSATQDYLVCRYAPPGNVVGQTAG